MSNKHRFDVSQFEVKPGSKVNLGKLSTKGGKELLDRSQGEEAFADDITALRDAQDRLYANDRYGLLVILQGMDASGKDGIIRHVMSGVNPLGCRAYAFKAPNSTELEHHFLWRPGAYLPEKGMISLFNRSYYEEVIVVRVHPDFLPAQRIAKLKSLKPKSLDKLWDQRYREINAFERSLTAHGTLILKFFLHVSKAAQKERFLERLQEPEKHWKFNPRDIAERKLWATYRKAYEDALSQTSTKWAPWYVIPADDKWYARAAVADLIAAKLEGLKIDYPSITEQQRDEYAKIAAELQREKD